MTKIYMIISIIIFSFMLTHTQSLGIASQEKSTKCNITETKRNELIDYSSFDILCEVYEQNRPASYIMVCRTVIYESDVPPIDMLNWSEVIKNEVYTGTLSLLKYNIASGKTTAIYTGLLSMQ